MNNNLQIFTNPQFGKIRTIIQNGEPWFIATDVCKALEIENSRKATSRLDDDEKNTVTLSDGNKGNPNVTAVTEAGLYSLVLGSRKPEAKQFKRWITHEVLPSIRKTGAYAVDELLDNPELAIRAFTALKEEREKNRRLTAENERMRPKEIFCDAVSASESSGLVGDLAKLLKQNGIEMGQKRMFQWLRDNGYLIKQKGASWNMPTQKAMEMRLFEIKETVITHNDGHITVNRTPKVTGKGQVYFINKFMSKKGEIE